MAIKQIKLGDVIHDINAVRLDIDTKGSTTQPVYFSEGKPVACTYELKKTVPSDAKFTDTTYTLNSFGITATAAELNKMDGVTATTAELNYVDGVTSNIQTQLNAKAAATTLSSHTGNKSNPHGVTKSQVGLGNVENKSSATIRGELTKTNVTTALGYTPPTTNTTYGVVSTTADGLAPKLAGGTAKYLRADGTWATPPDTDTVYTHPSYTARTGVPTANATLSFGGTFNVSQPVSDATGHITAVNSRTYTMPSDRLFTTLTPTGTAIPQNANLATSTYLKVGRYYCSQDVIAATLKNAPTANAFMMEVYSPLSTTIDNESGAWVYRVRKITTYMGEQYIQYSYTGGTAGSWNHQPWRRIYHSDAITYGTAAPGGTAVNGDIYFREDIHATLPITEGGTGATSVSAARANLGLNHVGAAAVCKSDSRTISITTAGGFAVIPMVQSALRTNDSNFTISNNGIQCPYSGYVYITGAIYVNTSGLAGCYIYKNGDNGELHSQYHTSSGCISSGGMLVPVTAGDVITMKARSSTANPTIGGNNKGTHLSIIYVA